MMNIRTKNTACAISAWLNTHTLKKYLIVSFLSILLAAHFSANAQQTRHSGWALFLNTINTQNKNNKLFNQFRTFGCVGCWISKEFDLELVYRFQWIGPRNGSNTQNHVA